MSRVLDYLERAYEGLQQYLSHNNLVVILVAVLLFFFLSEKKEKDNKANGLLIYTVLMLVILICPLSAMAVMIYQTAFYDYTWAWSLVPVTIVMAYGITIFWEKEKSSLRRWGIIGVTVIILCLIGNQGMIQRVPTQEVTNRSETKEILREIHAFCAGEDCIAWGPKRIMQEIRRHDGEIMLVYGKDMWDQKSGAYDYEAYSQELTDAYLWLEAVMDYFDLAMSVETPEETLGFLDEQYEWSFCAKEHIGNVVKAGADTIILPELVGTFLEEDIKSIAKEHGKNLNKAYRAGYVIWVIG